MDAEEFDRVVKTVRGRVMRKPLLLLALMTLMALVAMPFSPALAARPESLVIDTVKPGGPFTGTFEASGAFVDEGTFEVIESRITGTQSELLLNNHLTYEFTSENGTFRLTTQNRITFGEPLSTVDGHWRVTGGTGNYAGLSGEGSLEGTLDSDGIFHLTLTGRVQLD